MNLKNAAVGAGMILTGACEKEIGTHNVNTTDTVATDTFACDIADPLDQLKYLEDTCTLDERRIEIGKAVATCIIQAPELNITELAWTQNLCVNTGEAGDLNLQSAQQLGSDCLNSNGEFVYNMFDTDGNNVCNLQSN